VPEIVKVSGAGVTSTAAVAVAVLPYLSVVEHEMVVEPNGKPAPEAGVHDGVPVLPS
jgi:hypothetical protein